MFSSGELRAGVLFAAKPTFQVLFNPLVARYLETSVALRVGTLTGALGSILFGLAPGNFVVLVLVRAVQGAASAGVMTGGMSHLLSQHDEEDQPKAPQRWLKRRRPGPPLRSAPLPVRVHAKSSAAPPQPPRSHGS